MDFLKESNGNSPLIYMKADTKEEVGEEVKEEAKEEAKEIKEEVEDAEEEAKEEAKEVKEEVKEKENIRGTCCRNSPSSTDPRVSLPTIKCECPPIPLAMINSISEINKLEPRSYLIRRC